MVHGVTKKGSLKSHYESCFRSIVEILADRLRIGAGISLEMKMGAPAWQFAPTTKIFGTYDKPAKGMTITDVILPPRRKGGEDLEITIAANFPELGSAAKLNPRSAPYLGPPSDCLLYTSPSPRDQRGSRMPSSA